MCVRAPVFKIWHDLTSMETVHLFNGGYVRKLIFQKDPKFQLYLTGPGIVSGERGGKEPALCVQFTGETITPSSSIPVLMATEIRVG